MLWHGNSDKEKNITMDCSRTMITISHLEDIAGICNKICATQRNLISDAYVARENLLQGISFDFSEFKIQLHGEFGVKVYHFKDMIGFCSKYGFMREHDTGTRFNNAGIQDTSSSRKRLRMFKTIGLNPHGTSEYYMSFSFGVAEDKKEYHLIISDNTYDGLLNHKFSIGFMRRQIEWASGDDADVIGEICRMIFYIVEYSTCAREGEGDFSIPYYCKVGEFDVQSGYSADSAYVRFLKSKFPNRTITSYLDAISHGNTDSASEKSFANLHDAALIIVCGTPNLTESSKEIIFEVTRKYSELKKVLRNKYMFDGHLSDVYSGYPGIDLFLRCLEKTQEVKSEFFPYQLGIDELYVVYNIDIVSSLQDYDSYAETIIESFSNIYEQINYGFSILDEILKVSRKNHYKMLDGQVNYQELKRKIRTVTAVDFNGDILEMLLQAGAHEHVIQASTHEKGISYEKQVSDQFRVLGYEIESTPVTGDYGVDLILSNNVDRIAVQCKNYSSVVGVDAVMQVYSGMAYYNCNSSMVISPSGFTDNAREMASKLGVKLLTTLS